MAVIRQENVIKITADADTIADRQYVCYIIYIPGTGSPNAVIRETDVNGKILWEAGSSTARIGDTVQLRLTGPTYFTMAGVGTSLYLYTVLD